jgi:RNA polymerase sigma-70 factor (ECF subfamily)
MSKGDALHEDAGLRAAYSAHGAELYRFALRTLGDEWLAEDAVQETFLRAWRSAAGYDPQMSSLRTWLFAIARNVIIDASRTRSQRPAAPAPDLPRSADELEQALLACQLEEAFRRISEDHRRALIETYYRGRPYSDVAGELGIPEGTLRSRVFYGLRALRLALEEMECLDDG